ncbi:tellurite resistance TerB family protein [Rhodobacteraceae bacterium N5(2021)]|uniref:Tellurite resistance TerB family protein n=1 Tax=Gymnodinialimonas phycosphaerae TaxID=2841589 RepID=A0A975TVE9_9RHOB|nr:tellurite resistance TerB family protein [Gymnodinialimonas phycosphaerae]MBY4891596.1 tellurite resistance TerB family protein [Gymnodinialimonas phycosphaerae]
MSLLRTLATVAVGVAAARGARALTNRGNRDERRGGGGLLDSLRGQDGRDSGGLGARERRFVEDELDARIDVRDFARDVPDHPGLRAQIFAAAMSAIDVDSPREREFAEDLANALGLEEKARGHVQRRLSGTYGQQPDTPWQKQDVNRAYSQPIQAPASAGGAVRGTKGMQGNAGMGRPYRK